MQRTANHTKKKPHNARKQPKKQAEEASSAILLQNTAKSLLITAAIGIALITAASLIAYFTADPIVWIPPLSLCASALTALLGGFAAAKINGSAALLCGLINGTVMTAVIMLASLFFKSMASGYSAPVSFLLHAAFILLSALGGWLGQKRARHPHRRK